MMQARFGILWLHDKRDSRHHEESWGLQELSTIDSNRYGPTRASLFPTILSSFRCSLKIERPDQDRYAMLTHDCFSCKECQEVADRDLIFHRTMPAAD